MPRLSCGERMNPRASQPRLPLVPSSRASLGESQPGGGGCKDTCQVLRIAVLFFSLHPHPDRSKKKEKEVKVGERLPETVTEGI